MNMKKSGLDEVVLFFYFYAPSLLEACIIKLDKAR